MPIDILSDIHPEFQNVVEVLRSDISVLRTGRANPNVLDVVMVEAYGTMNPLSSMASIAVPDARSLVVDPWDKSNLKAIEVAITAANLGLNPTVQGQSIRIPIAAPTEETRKQLVKQLGEKLEHARKSVRNVRDEAKAAIQKAEKEGEIGEDEKYRLLEELDKKAASINDKIKKIGEDKEKEIMTI